MGLRQYFDVNKTGIVCKVTGSEFLFKGLRHNASEIKSTEGVDVCWVEEAHGVSHESWQLLTPTVRAPGSEIWVCFNPDLETDPTYQRFVASPPPSALVRLVNFRDNPWFPEVLEEERLYLLGSDLDAYMHVWEGKPRKRNKAAILEEKCVVDRFSISDTWSGPYYGIDWGFGSDPFACVTLYVDEDKNRLYVRRETWALKLELNLTAPRVRKEHPGIERYVVRADNARPESISHVSHTPVGEALPRIVGADKWPGSVEDGIEYLRTFDAIVIHEECTHMQQEAHDYSYAVDPRTGDVLPKIVDKHNHLWDAIRYALAPRIRQRKTNTAYAGTHR